VVAVEQAENFSKSNTLRAKVFFLTTKNHFPRFSFLDSKKSLLFGVPLVLHIEISVPHISFNFFEPKNFDCDMIFWIPKRHICA